MKRNVKARSFARGVPLPWSGAYFSTAFLVFVSLVLMVVSAVRPQVFTPLRNNVTDFFAPLVSAVSLPFQNFAIILHDVTGLAQLQADNKRLVQENAKLREWYQMAQILDAENKSLRKLLNMKPSPEYDHIGARVISDSGNTYVKSLLVTIGGNDGVKKNAAVLSGDGLIGRIVDVSEHTARVLLITDINSRVPVVVEDTGQHAILAGANKYMPYLVHLSRESEIGNGARIITSGYGGVYPHGIPVGRVVLSETGRPEVVLYADFEKLQNVKIMQEKQ